MKVHKEKLMNFDSSIFVDTVYANQSSLNATRWVLTSIDAALFLSNKYHIKAQGEINKSSFQKLCNLIRFLYSSS